jgi:UDP-N-acetylglucosamine/UDP-N-acetylgalactosamine diphosphorylase
LRQLSGFDFNQLNDLFRLYKKGAGVPAEDTIEPAQVILLPKTTAEFAAREEARLIGEETLREGEVAAFVVAGGQATRLGVDVPKGTLSITPIKQKSIFQTHAEKILALSKKYNRSIPFYIMTSEANDRPTREFFEGHRFFGLNPADVFFFQQDMMPALDLEGKLILDAKEHIFTSPNGHGGSIFSLKQSGALDDMRRRGIEYIFYFQVDNVLIKIADPVFLGYHIQEQAEMSAKVTPKRNPEEKVGVVCRAGGKTTVIEYSDLPDTHRYARNPDGSLKFSAGSIAIHVLDVDFVERLNEHGHSLPFHIAEKAIPYLTAQGKQIKPREKNGLKFEMFVFDALSLAENTVIMEVDRNEEFAPVKNAQGEDSPDMARELLTRMFAKWLIDAGARLTLDAKGNPAGPIEISPLFVLNSEELRQKLPPSYEAHPPLYLGPEK